MKLLKKLIIFIIVLAFLLCLLVFGIFIYAQSEYGINLFDTINQVKLINEKIDEDLTYNNKFNSKDYESLVTKLNSVADNLITYTNINDYKTYNLNYSALIGKTLTSEFKLNEKEIGALSQISFYKQTNGYISMKDYNINIELLQFEFNEIKENSSIFSITSKINLEPFKNELKQFPLSLINNVVPDYLYINSKVLVKKLDNEFKYNVTSNSITFNKLDYYQTTDFYNTFSQLFYICSLEELNLEIGKNVVDYLIGNEDNIGFAYSFKLIGATKYNVKCIENTNYLIIN